MAEVHDTGPAQYGPIVMKIPREPGSPSAETLHIRQLENGLEPLRPFAPRTQTFGVSGCRRCLHRVANARSFKTIPASEETTNTQRFEANSLAEEPGFEP